jgi:hypothetical protein
VVTRYTALSQSEAAMTGRDFQRSKQAVLEFIAGLLGVGRPISNSKGGRRERLGPKNPPKPLKGARHD